MKLSKLYCNLPKLFKPIEFNDGLNVILGDIRQPENSNLDTHNLGKTTLAKVLDFTFLVRRDKDQFFFKHFETFKSFVFFLEISSSDGEFLTIRRGVDNNSKISFKIHNIGKQDYHLLRDEDWSHVNLPMSKAKSFLESWLNFDVLSTWDYRKLIGYLIRTQNDFDTVFRLNKYRGKDVDWKPYMADLLGFNGNLMSERYQLDSEINKLNSEIMLHSFFDTKSISQELSKIDNRILLRNNDLKSVEALVETFNFSEIDQQAIEELINEIDIQISDANQAEYNIRNNIVRIQQSLVVDKINFDTNEVSNLFEEAKVLFPDQITKSFEQLIEFSNSITVERNDYLKSELVELNNELLASQGKLKQLNETRAQKINFLVEKELVSKFKQANLELINIKTEISILHQQKDTIDKILNLEKKKKELEKTISDIEIKMQENVNSVNESNNNIFANIRIFFNSIINKVLNKEGSLTVFLNSNGNFDFNAEYQDKFGKNTSEGDGNTYQKFLCIAFDLAVVRAYLDKNFPKFLYIDGVFDGLDNRKKQLILDVIREYCDLNIQIIITTINSETSSLVTPIAQNEIVLTLHDDGSSGRLFKMPLW